MSKVEFQEVKRRVARVIGLSAKGNVIPTTPGEEALTILQNPKSSGIMKKAALYVRAREIVKQNHLDE